MLATSSPMHFAKTLRNCLTLLFFFTYVFYLSGQTTLWLEDFSGANQGWTTNFVDCDGTAASFAGVNNNRFEITDMEGAPCCTTGGGGDNDWITNPINIANYCNVTISVNYGFIGVFECVAGGPFFGCTNNVAIDNGHDQIVFEYRINGGAWIQFAYVCGGQTGTATIAGLTGNTIEIRIRPSNKATAETYWFDNVKVVGTQPVVNQPPNVVVCAGQPIAAAFTGSASTTFTWSNNNTATGVGASGTGNISATGASVTNQEISTITVTPTIVGCPGPPKMFTVTVNPTLTVDPPGNVIVCSGDPVGVNFTGTSPTFTWTNSNPAIGIGASGNGNLNFNAAAVATTQTGTITVTPASPCPGPPQMFTITVNPLPTVNQPANIVSCGGTITANFAGSAGTTFSWSNDNTAIGLGASGNGNISFPAASVGSQEVATITVTPQNGPCPGVPKTFTITINPNSLVDDPSDVAVCGGDPINVIFSGTSPTFSWTNSNPAIGLGGSGTGNLNFNAASVATTQTGNITVTPTGPCPGPPQMFTITVSPLPTVNQPANIVSCGGTITANFTGSAGTTFSWSNDNTAIGLGASGNGNISFPAAAVGSQEVATITVTPQNGPCPGVPRTFTITINPASLVDDPANVAACGGEPISVAFSGTSPTFSWTNSNPAIGLGGSGSGNLNFNAAGVVTTQTGTITVTPTGPCPGPAQTFTITVNPLPSVNQPANQVACGGATVNANFTGTGGATFSWTNDNPAIGLGASGNGNISFPSVIVANQEVATITVTPQNGPCPGTPRTFTITINPASLVDDPGDVAVCGGEPISVAFSGSSPTFSWTNSNPAIGLGASGNGNLNFNAAAVVATQTGTITVTPTGPCPGPAETFTITVSPLPTVSQPANQVACGGAMVNANFAGSGGATFSWTNDNTAIGLGASGNGNISFPSAAVANQEVATITVTPQNGACPGTPRTFTITINPPSLVNDPADVAACGSDPISVIFSGTSPTFSWTNSNPAIGLGAAGNGNLNFNAAAVATTQTGTITVTPTGPCPGPAQTFTITVSALPTVSQPANVAACGGNAVNVNFTGAGSPTFSWTNNNPGIGLGASGSGDISFSSASVATQQVATITVTPESSGCPGTPRTFTITINPATAVNAPADESACVGELINVVFSGTSPTFSWTNSNTAIGLGASGNGNLNFNAAAVVTTQTGTITVTPSGACPGPAQMFTITVSPPPTVTDPADATACANEAVSVNFSGTGSPTFSWTNSNPTIGLPASGTGDLSFNAGNVATIQTGTITVTPISGGCNGPTQTFTITVNPAPSVTQPANQALCAGANILATFSGSTGATFSWTNSNPNIGLGASGTGNINMASALVAVQEVAMITVTPQTAGCPGTPKTFMITVNPAPTVNATADLSACGGQTVNVPFTANGAPTLSWTNSNVAIGLGASGTGTINFVAANLGAPQTGIVVVTPTGGVCPGQSDTFNINVVTAPTVNQPANANACTGNTVNIPLSGTAGSQFSWTNSNTSIGLPASGTGSLSFTAANVATQQTATITVTPELGSCMGSPINFTITLNPAPTATIAGNQTVCSGSSTTLTANGGSNYVWSTMQTIAAITVTPTTTTTYTVTVSNAAGCTATNTATVTVNATSSSTVSKTSCDPAQVGTTMQTLTNQAGCDSVVTTITTLLPSNTTNLAQKTCNPANTGTFTQILTNQFGCDSTVITVVTFDPAAIDTTILAKTSCDPTQVGSVQNLLAGTDGCDSLIITNTSLLLSNTTNLAQKTCNPANAGTFTQMLTNQFGCDSTVVTVIIFDPANIDTTILAKTSCDPTQVGSVQNLLAGADGCDSLVITNTSLLPSNTVNLAQKTCNPANTGTFTQMLTNQFGCDSTVVTVVTFDPAAIDTTIIAKTSCDPTQVGSVQNMLVGVDGCDSLIITNTSLLPSNTTNLAQKTCNPANTGTFTQMLTNQFGCDSTVVTVVTFDPTNIDTTILAMTSCDPTQVGSVQNLLVGVGGCDSLIITNTSLLPSNTTNLAQKTCNPANAGTFTQMLTNQFGCDSTVVTVVTYDPAAVDTTIISKTSCDPTQAGSVQNLLVGADGCDSLVITNTALLPTNTINLAQKTCNPANAGTFTQMLTNQFGCDSTVVTVISYDPAAVDTTIFTLTTCDPSQVGSVPVLMTGTDGCDSLIITNTVIDATLCGATALISTNSVSCSTSTDGQASITVSSGQTPLTYQWKDGAGNTGTGQITSLNTPVSITGLSAGTFAVTVTPAIGTTTVLTANVVAPPALVSQTTAVLAFNGFAISCANLADGSVQTTTTGGTAPYQFLWDNNATTPNLFDLSAGSYQLTITDQNGCTTQSTVTLTAPEPLLLALQLAPTDCGDAFADAAVSASGGAGSYATAVDGTPVTGLVVPVPAGSHTVQITDANGCIADTTLTVSLPPVPVVSLPTDTLVSLGESLTIEAQTNLNIWQSVVWQPLPDTSCANCLLQTWSPTATRRYSVTIVDTSGCAATASMLVKVDRHIDIYIPNVFSPDGDGLNDLFLISVGPSVAEVSVFRIFDRWGEMVYNWDDPVPAQLWPGWDGRLGGRKVEVGVYVYYLKVKLIDGDTKILSGDLTITKR